MSIEEKVGQLFIVGFDGNAIDGKMINLIATYKVGGVAYFSPSFKHPKQVHKLSTYLQYYANKEFPLFLTVQQAGGKRNTITNGVTISPSQHTLGKVNNRLYTKQMAEIIGLELKAMGINLNIAPNLDVNEENDNSFGSKIEFVSRHALAAIQGYQKAELISAAKIDTYLKQGIINNSLHSTSLKPLLDKLLTEVDSLHVSNDVFTNFKEEVQSTSSDSLMVGLLREELAFDGVIMTDYSYQSSFNPEEVAISPLLAGVDVILLNDTYKNQLRTIDGVIQAVRDGIISEERINRSVERILTLKAKRNISVIAPFERDKFQRKRSIAFTDKLNNLVLKN